MITESEKNIIRDISKKYHVKHVMLFGSGIDAESQNRDIDIAIEGIMPQDFFKYYGELMFALPKPVDVVELSSDSKFNRMIRQEGITLYG